MCGIAGFLNASGTYSAEAMQAVVQAMASCLVHRGPDASGEWVDAQMGIALGHRRLSILDLSPQGHQPMVSESGRFVIVFNGEIYNFLELRRELEVHGSENCPNFRGHSDTEVMLAAFERWGVKPSITRFNGMFAFALWDRRERVLYLARDRVGEKPLYYGWMGSTFLFGSELKALRAHPEFCGEVSRDALALYMRFCYVPAPYSIYRQVHKLPPGCLLTVPGPLKDHALPSRYWSAREVAETGTATPFSGSMDEAVVELDTLLRDSVRLRMVADVPLGALLSGGIDSSTVVALMQAQSGRPVKSFTIGFKEPHYNEAVHAAAVARYLGTEHTELYVTPEDAMDVIQRLPDIYDEPFADSSQVPTFLVCELARRHVTVSLSGDGGDELFGGYIRYLLTRKIRDMVAPIPKPMRRAIAAGLTALSPESWDALFEKMNFVLPDRFKQRSPGEKLNKLAALMVLENADAMYGRLVSVSKNCASWVLHGCEPPTTVTNRSEWAELPEFTSRMMYLDLVTYLPDDILVKLDRASMSVSLEGRVPLLDHRVVEFAWQLPLPFKLRDGKGKWLLRQVLYKYVPQKLVERPKAGFAVPIGSWLRGPLREWAEALLDECRLEQDGFLDPKPIRETWARHLSGRADFQYELWNVLMFQAWLEKQKNSYNTCASWKLAAETQSHRV